ncbi:MAG: hypothetical protein SGPRY_007273, partial [Prymnesium sp.]
SEQEVQSYLDAHKIEKTVEDAINACVKANAEDPCLFMSQHLATKAGPDTIKQIKARQIFDSRGNPTVEVDLITAKGQTHRASVPSGASTGIYEGGHPPPPHAALFAPRLLILADCALHLLPHIRSRRSLPTLRYQPCYF